MIRKILYLCFSIVSSSYISLLIWKSDWNKTPFVVIETLRRIAQLLPEASSQQRSRLRKLPLWSGNRWVENRPVYAFEDINIASQTESQLPVWISGFTSYSGLHDLLDALNVILITPEDFTPVNLSAKSAVGGAPFRYRVNIAA